MAVTREDVASAAVQLERDGRRFYLDAAGRTRDELTRKMFKSLADDELDHIEWIRNMVPGVQSAGAANRQLYDRLRHIFADVPEAGVRKAAHFQDDVKAIHLAIDMENKSIDAYQTWAGDAEEKDVKSTCQMLVEIEEFHRLVLTNTLEYFEHTPDWFMQEEHWNFEGA